MKQLKKVLPLALMAVFLTSCVSVRVASDYDERANFTEYKSFAFYKPGIDEAEINDIDKRRILRAIESEMLTKGFIKSENPDLLVSIFTKSRDRLNVWNGGWGWGGWGWGGWGWGNPWWGGAGWGNTVSRSTEGVLYVDLIDAEKRELIWQGSGTGYLSRNRDKKEDRIREFVKAVLAEYPPGAGQ